MAIELSETEHTANRVMTGSNIYAATAGQTLAIETSPNGEDILSEEVPVGKVWEVHLSVYIKETNIQRS